MIKINGLELAEQSTFPGGETHIKLPDLAHLKQTIDFRKKNVSSALPSILVEAKIRSASDLMQLILVKDALDESFLKETKGLKIMYMPYARQDRVCNLGEAFSARVFANLLNSMEFEVIITADVHSNVILEYLVTPVIQISVDEIFGTKFQPLLPNMVLVAPDKGSFTKVKKLAEMIGVPFISANKIRKGDNIQIELEEYNIDLIGKNLLIVDDICDGGGTFIALSKLLEYKNPLSINLYVTHGIFSKGLAPLRSAGIDRIYTTNSINTLNSVNNELFIWEI